MNPMIPPPKILDSVVLMLITHKGPSHGYALATAIEERFGWKPSQTAIYNSLKSLESDGMVTSEERIESGRVQKIYSCTRKGKKQFEETHQHMKKIMMRNFTRFFSFIQMVGDIESSEESEAFQKRMHNSIENMRNISFLAMFLLREASKETEKVIEEFLASLMKIAEEKEIKIPEEIIVETSLEYEE
jgi:DNA-binding PadR family transcriptional regulator